jgi:hypothetical protein
MDSIADVVPLVGRLAQPDRPDITLQNDDGAEA